MNKSIYVCSIALIALTGAVMVQAATHHKSSESASMSESANPNNALSYGANGQIIAVDIQDKTIQIGQTVYGIADGVQVVNKDNNLMSQLALLPGETIEFNLEKQPLDRSSHTTLPSQVMTHIRIVSGLIEEKVNK